MIPVTKTFFPPLEEYNKQLQRIWTNQWLTNRGELVLELEDRLQTFLSVPNIILTTNGTLPIQIALKLLAKKGEVITTPFSYVATTSSIVWENCTPVFVDIHPEYLTIDEEKIEEAITEKTTAILATHVFGNPCNVERIAEIAKKHELKIIYDAAHCFGVEYKGKSIFTYGEVSTCSFHATKLFHTGEGGALFCEDEELNHKLYYSHNFGHKSPTEFYDVGINAKMSELQAAMGLSVLPYMREICHSRKETVKYYNQNLSFKNFRTLIIRENTVWNWSYYPIIFEDEMALKRINEKLEKIGVYPRRYFFPSLNTLNYVGNFDLKISEKIAGSILCLPLYYGLEKKSLDKIIEILNDV